MSDEIKVINLAPVTAGWWVKFTNDDGLIWYSPVAALALCMVEDGELNCTYQEILPVLAGETGLEPYLTESGQSDVVYLPDARLATQDNDYSFLSMGKKK